MKALLQLLASFVVGYSYGVVAQVPRRYLLAGGFVGAGTWGGYLVGMALFPGNRIVGAFFGGIAVGLGSEICARRFRAPVTAFLVPGLITLVPGADAYLTMLYFLESQWERGITSATTTLFLAGAIAAGVVLTGSVFRIGVNLRTNRRPLL
ncbi:MAG: threonine/serine exporter [Firmicutes bacterium]|nr:threonine/serine exporter [Bacillota bacterium]